LSDFSKIFYEEAERHADKSHKTKTANFKIQDGELPPLNPHISVKNRPISMKFGTLQQILNQITVT